MCRNTACENFQYSENQWPNFSLNSKNPIFGHFSAKLSCCAHNFLRVSGTIPQFREIQWSNFKKTPRQMSGGKDGQTLFHRIIPATTMGLTSKTAKNWHLEVKYIEHKVCLTKSYCITVSMQKISFRVLWPGWPHPPLTMSIPKFLILINF